jgi:hypothetical protein
MRPIRWLAILAGAYCLGQEIAGSRLPLVLERWDRRRRVRRG